MLRIRTVNASGVVLTLALGWAFPASASAQDEAPPTGAASPDRSRDGAGAEAPAPGAPPAAPDVAPGEAPGDAPEDARADVPEVAPEDAAPPGPVAPADGADAPQEPAPAGPSATPRSAERPGVEAAPPARRQRRLLSPADAQDAQAWRAWIAPDLDVVERIELAARALGEAELALAARDADGAQASLQTASGALQALLVDGAGAHLASRLGQAAAELQLPDPVDVPIDDLVAEVDDLAPILPPSVRTFVDDARRQARSGNARAATRSLLDARAVLVADLALLPLEQAFARTRAALAEVDAGNLALALDLVQGVPASIAQARRTTPLVPARLRLRAAAHAAVQRNWVEAESLLNEASADLAALRADATPALARRIDGLAARIGGLREQIAAGRPPSPARFRQVAESAGGVPAG